MVDFEFLYSTGLDTAVSLGKACDEGLMICLPSTDAILRDQNHDCEGRHRCG